jgi:hypothetical protein
VKRFRIGVDTGFVGATHEDEIEFTDEEWEAMSEDERRERLDGEVENLISNHINGWAEEIE